MDNTINHDQSLGNAISNSYIGIGGYLSPSDGSYGNHQWDNHQFFRQRSIMINYYYPTQDRGIGYLPLPTPSGSPSRNYATSQHTYAVPYSSGYSSGTDVAKSGGGENSWISDAWNSTIVRGFTGDAIFVNTTSSLVFLGGGSNATGVVLPLHGPDAFKLNYINTASFRLGAQGGWDVSAGKMWFNGPVESAYLREINGYGTSLDVNLGLVLGWGPGAGVFESHNDAGKTTWFGAYGSFGYGIGGSFGFDYTYTTPVFGK